MRGGLVYFYIGKVAVVLAPLYGICRKSLPVKPFLEKGGQVAPALRFHIAFEIGCTGIFIRHGGVVEITAKSTEKNRVAEFPSQHVQHIGSFVIGEPGVEC